MERDFGKWRHLVESDVNYRYIGNAGQFRDTIVVDNVDLVTHTNEVEYGLTNRFFTKREIFSWRLSQKYFLDPTFGGAIIPGRRNVFEPLLDITGFTFADGRRRFSPIISEMRLATSPSTSEDIEVDYDTRDHLFEAQVSSAMRTADNSPAECPISSLVAAPSKFQAINCEAA